MKTQALQLELNLKPGPLTHSLTGCGLASLGDYLKTLGILRRLPKAKGHWKGSNFYLDYPHSCTELIEELAKQQRFAPLLSPWNKSSLYWSSKLDALLDLPQTDQHFPGLRDVKADYDELCLELGITSKAEAKKNKSQLLNAATEQIENREHQSWLSSVFRLEHGTDKKGNATLKPHYSHLLGAGGIFGTQDIANLYLRSAQSLLQLGPDPAQQRWEASLFGGSVIGIDVGTSGLGYFPAAGLINDAKPSGLAPYCAAQGKLDPFCSYTDLILLVEGLLLLSGTTVQVLEAAENEVAHYPLVVRSLRGANLAIGAEEEKAAEQKQGIHEAWLPLWHQPMTASRLKRNLLTALRAPMSRRAPDAYDFIQQVALQANKHGVNRFARCLFLPRYGQSFYGIMGDIFTPHLSPVTLDPVRRWLGRAAWLKPEQTPKTFAGLIRSASLQFGACIEGRGSNLALLLALGELERYMARAPSICHHISFLPDLKEDWAKAILDEEPQVTTELEIALSLASLHSPTLRHFWRAKKQGGNWTSPGCWKHGLIDSLIAVQRRARYDEQPFALQPRAPNICASLDATAAFIAGHCDDALISSYLWGLSLCRMPPLTFSSSALGAIQIDPLFRALKLSEECNSAIFERLVTNDRQGAIRELQQRLALKNKHISQLEYTTGETHRIAAALLLPLSPHQLRQPEKHSGLCAA